MGVISTPGRLLLALDSILVHLRPLVSYWQNVLDRMAAAACWRA